MRRARLLLLPAAALLLAACAGAPPATPPTAQPAQPSRPTPPAAEEPTTPAGGLPFNTLAARFIDRAIRLERAGELPRALAAWRVVAALRPEAEEPKRRVDDLAARLESEAERRYLDGLSRLEAGDLAAARREFLLALAANPDHAAALDAVKNRLEPDAVPYTVAAGDTFAEIAKKRYGDPAKAALVARANDLDPAGQPSPGAVLMLPSLTPLLGKVASPAKKPAADEKAEESAYDTEPSAISPDLPPTAAPPVPPALKPADQAEEQLARAAELLKARKYEEAATAADKLAGNPAVGARARELSGNAWFAMGDAASREERFVEAIVAYKRAEPARKKDAAAAIAAVERRKKEKAEEYYSAGVRYFIDQQLDDAIRSWELTLALNPEHPTAPRDLEKARKLKRQLEEIR